MPMNKTTQKRKATYSHRRPAAGAAPVKNARSTAQSSASPPAPPRERFFSSRPCFTYRFLRTCLVAAAFSPSSRAAFLACAARRTSMERLRLRSRSLYMVCTCCISLAAARSSGSATTARSALSDPLRGFFAAEGASSFGLDLYGSAACSAFGTASLLKRRGARSMGLYSESALTRGAAPSSARTSAPVRMRSQPRPCGASRLETGLYSVGSGTGTQALSSTRSERSSLSSKVARNVPSSACSARLTWPRTPETVRRAAPSNFATSSAEVNMSLMKAVFLKTLNGEPTSFSFLTTLRFAATSSTTPVAEMRKLLRASVWKQSTPVFGGTCGPWKAARQCMCSGVYLMCRSRKFGSWT
mmetsp:Transcript_26152/g.83764  ORF Transcript_26152/g.83764 Transcript_26152/m.83764 type:complete len:357 (+) Transcript_26152:190-1260(+)